MLQQAKKARTARSGPSPLHQPSGREVSAALGICQDNNDDDCAKGRGAEKRKGQRGRKEGRMGQRQRGRRPKHNTSRSALSLDRRALTGSLGASRDPSHPAACGLALCSYLGRHQAHKHPDQGLQAHCRVDQTIAQSIPREAHCLGMALISFPSS